MEINIETMSLSDLKQIKSILEEKLSQKKKWMDSERGRRYDEFCRRQKIYLNDKNHLKLERINQRIDEFIKAI